MRIDLTRIPGRRRKPRPFRAIVPTKSQQDDLARLMVRVPALWQDQATARLMPEYTRTLSQVQTDSIFDIETIIQLINEMVQILITTEIRNGMGRWANSLAEWHFRKFVSEMKYATNIDLDTVFVQGRDQSQTVADFLARNTALIRDVSDQTRGRIADIVFRSLQQRLPARDVAREIAKATGMGRKRALRIAMDQTQKLSSALDAQRAIAIGAPGYLWQHSHKLNYRPEHLARDGDYVAFGSEIDQTDPPGFAPFCGCRRRIVLEEPRE